KRIDIIRVRTPIEIVEAILYQREMQTFAWKQTFGRFIGRRQKAYSLGSEVRRMSVGRRCIVAQRLTPSAKGASPKRRAGLCCVRPAAAPKPRARSAVNQAIG